MGAESVAGQGAGLQLSPFVSTFSPGVMDSGTMFLPNQFTPSATTLPHVATIIPAGFAMAPATRSPNALPISSAFAASMRRHVEHAAAVLNGHPFVDHTIPNAVFAHHHRLGALHDIHAANAVMSAAYVLDTSFGEAVPAEEGRQGDATGYSLVAYVATQPSGRTDGHKAPQFDGRGARVHGRQDVDVSMRDVDGNFAKRDKGVPRDDEGKGPSDDSWDRPLAYEIRFPGQDSGIGTGHVQIGPYILSAGGGAAGSTHYNDVELPSIAHVTGSSSMVSVQQGAAFTTSLAADRPDVAPEEESVGASSVPVADVQPTAKAPDHIGASSASRNEPVNDVEGYVFTDVSQASAATATLRPGEEVSYEADFGGMPTVRFMRANDRGEDVFVGWQERDFQAFYGAPVESHAEAEGRYEEEGGRIFGLGMPGGETAYKQSGDEEPYAAISEGFFAIVTSQLAMGPDALRDQKFLDAANNYLARELPFSFTRPLTMDEWRGYVSHALAQAVAYSPIFDDGGARTVGAIVADAASLVGIDAAQFQAWEEALGLDSVFSRLIGDFGPQIVGTDEFRQMLVDSMDDMIGAIAGVRFGGQTQTIADYAYRAEGQWALAAGLMLEGEAKLSAVHDLVRDLMKARKKHVAGYILAMAFKHSALNELPNDGDEFLPRLSEAEWRALARILMVGDTWSMASHRAFRMHLSLRENETMNAVIAEANYQNSIAELHAIDVTTASDEEFWAAVDRTGVPEDILDFAISKMAASFRQ